MTTLERSRVAAYREAPHALEGTLAAFESRAPAVALEDNVVQARSDVLSLCLQYVEAHCDERTAARVKRGLAALFTGTPAWSACQMMAHGLLPADCFETRRLSQAQARHFIQRLAAASCPVIFGQAASDNDAQRAVGAIRASFALHLIRPARF